MLTNLKKDMQPVCVWVLHGPVLTAAFARCMHLHRNAKHLALHVCDMAGFLAGMAGSATRLHMSLGRST